MRKRFLVLIFILALTFGTCGTALAEDSKRGTGGDLKSYGKIAYQNGSDAVVIDSEDFHMLADRLDLFKQRMADQLQAMHTYFTLGDGISLQTNADVSIAHTRPSDENVVNPLEVNFDTLLEGLAASQSVSSNLTDYGYPAGTELYKNAAGILTTDGSEEGAEKISVAAATADNLSAGTAAWVNGSLLLGTGEDNKSYFDSGNAEASSQIGQIDFIQYGGSLIVKVKDDYCMGPCDIEIPNKDVWLALPGPIAHNSRFTPAADDMVNNTYLSFQLYKKDPNLPDTAVRTLHLPPGGNCSGYPAPWYLLYLK